MFGPDDENTAVDGYEVPVDPMELIGYCDGCE